MWRRGREGSGSFSSAPSKMQQSASRQAAARSWHRGGCKRGFGLLTSSSALSFSSLGRRSSARGLLAPRDDGRIAACGCCRVPLGQGSSWGRLSHPSMHCQQLLGCSVLVFSALDLRADTGAALQSHSHACKTACKCPRPKLGGRQAERLWEPRSLQPGSSMRQAPPAQTPWALLAPSLGASRGCSTAGHGRAGICA